MKNKINEKIKMLWNEIRGHCKEMRNAKKSNYWYPMHLELFKEKLFAIKILKEIRG